MSIFTKIFVVLVMVLSVLLTALVVPFVTNVETYKAKYQAERAQRVSAEAQASDVQAQISAATQAQNQINSDKDRMIAQLQSDLEAKTTQLIDRDKNIVELQNSNVAIEGRLGELTAATKQMSLINDQLTKEVRDRREESIRLQSENVALNQQVRELTTTNSTLVDRVRLLQEDLAAAEVQIEDLRQRGPTTAVQAPTGAAPGVTETDQQIRGTVTEVRDISGQTFVVLNVGTQDQVRENMEFLIHQGENYLATVRIMTVDQTYSTGRVTQLKAPVTPNSQAFYGLR